jgi:hypothetical protein
VPDPHVIERAFEKLSLNLKVEGLVTGGAKGSDTEAAICGLGFWPTARHTLCWPQCDHEDLNRSLLDNSQDMRMRVITVAFKGSVSGTLMARNDAILAQTVREAQQQAARPVIVAFPSSPREQRRGSGTWATIRRARKMRLTIAVFPLDGSEPWLESA